MSLTQGKDLHIVNKAMATQNKRNKQQNLWQKTNNWLNFANLQSLNAPNSVRNAQS